MADGNFDAELTGTTWQLLHGSQVVTEGGSMESLNDLKSPCGDGLSLVVHHTLDVSMDGENLLADLTLDWTDGQADGTYNVKTTAGVTVVAERSTQGTNKVLLPAGSDTYVATVTYPLTVCQPFAAQSTVQYGGVQLALAQVRGVS
jgi:hypothetical protein